MGPPVDRDVVMAPPQFNPQQYPTPPNQPASVPQKPPQDCVDKYKRLKRKYFELEEVRVVVAKIVAWSLQSTHFLTSTHTRP